MSLPPVFPQSLDALEARLDRMLGRVKSADDKEILMAMLPLAGIPWIHERKDYSEAMVNKAKEVGLWLECLVHSRIEETREDLLDSMGRDRSQAIIEAQGLHLTALMLQKRFGGFFWELSAKRCQSNYDLRIKNFKLSASDFAAIERWMEVYRLPPFDFYVYKELVYPAKFYVDQSKVKVHLAEINITYMLRNEKWRQEAKRARRQYRSKLNKAKAKAKK
jgi:hypothetical protein